MYRFSRIMFANYRRLGSFKNQIDFTPKFPKIEPPIKFTLGATGFLGGLLGKKDEDPNKEESELIMAIKRGNCFRYVI